MFQCSLYNEITKLKRVGPVSVHQIKMVKSKIIKGRKSFALCFSGGGGDHVLRVGHHVGGWVIFSPKKQLVHGLRINLKPFS